ncbi:hypothetical protein G9A89_015759 [Geosiphon pyriformis]|nr:hypothetical protein G9A89_015759 [Geosiphon pyriformis]
MDNINRTESKIRNEEIIIIAISLINQWITTPFELVYSRTATLPVEIEINTYPTEPITEDNFQETLLRKTYVVMKTHNNQLPDKPVEFRIGDKVLLHCTKVEKQWNEKKQILQVTIRKQNSEKDSTWKLFKNLSNTRINISETTIKSTNFINQTRRYITRYGTNDNHQDAGHGEKKEEEEKEVKKLDRRQKQLYTTYLVLELEKIKKSLAYGTKLPKTGE